MRVAWFSPMPPVRSGVATCSAELVAALRQQGATIDVLVDEPVAVVARDTTRSAHDFLRLHRQMPYDLTIYQVGNSSHHDYLWPYLFRFPGLTVLHDAHVHHARAAALLRTKRADDYRVEFAASHPGDPPGAAELAVAGLDSHIYYMWPMTRLIVQASKLTAVHSHPIASQLRDEHGRDRIEHVRLSQGIPVSAEREKEARQRVRARYGIDANAVVFGCFGGLTREKRIPQILDAFAALLPYAPASALVLAGEPAAHYDLVGDLATRGLGNRAVATGYLESDEELTDCLAAVDVTLNLRWPTARETSGPWLRSLAAGKPSIVTDLLQTVDVPALDPRTWMPYAADRANTGEGEPIAIAIDIRDEEHSLRLAMRRLAEDAELRQTLGTSALRYWLREHSPGAMLDDYVRVMDAARARPAPRPALPVHLLDDGTRELNALLAPFGLPSPL